MHLGIRCNADLSVTVDQYQVLQPIAGTEVLQKLLQTGVVGGRVVQGSLRTQQCREGLQVVLAFGNFAVECERHQPCRPEHCGADVGLYPLADQVTHYRTSDQQQ